MSTQYVSNVSDPSVYRDRPVGHHVSDAKLRSLEIMAAILATVMILGPLAMAARSPLL